MIRPSILLSLIPAAGLAIAVSSCGSGSNTGPNPAPTPTPTPVPITNPTPMPTPDWRAQCGEPVPPPLYGMKVSVQLDQGFRKLVDSRPIVENVGRGNPTESYCGKVGFDWRQPWCDTRPEGHPQRVACDALVVGRASDTGRYGPTWTKDGKACVEPGSESDPGCTNHGANQFLVISRGPGELLACASTEWPESGPGSRCGGCSLKNNLPICEF